MGLICPDCKWEAPCTPYNIRRDGKVYVYQPNETPSEKAYPKILDQYKDWKGRLVFREVHKCSKCLREFEQTKILTVNE